MIGIVTGEGPGVVEERKNIPFIAQSLRVLSPKNGTYMESENLVETSGYAHLKPYNEYDAKLQNFLP